MSHTKPIALLLFSSSLLGCVSDGATDQTADEVAQAQACPVSGTDFTKSIVVTDPVVLKSFAFAKTIKQILKSSGAATTETTKTLYQQWMSTFGPTDCTNKKVDPQKYGEVCPRSNEFLLAGVDPTSGSSKVQFEPVGVFNRFDLAPKSGATCGEYRIVYAMHSTDPQISGRGFYIFEGALANPDPAAKLAGCLPIAEFWQNLSNDTPAQIATALEKFYYLGTAVPNVGPVVAASSYGLAKNGAGYTAGQIRSNMFINDFEWHLREFKTDLTCTTPGVQSTCTLTIDHVTVKNDPANELFAGTAKNSATFLTAFPKQVKALASGAIATIGMTTADLYNTYESVSEPEGLPGETNVLYTRFADAAMKTAISNELTTLGIKDFTAGDILNRATTQTCGGCHEVSSGTPLGPDSKPLIWPSSLGFVQIDESSNLSEALTGFFIPHRITVLENFINGLCGSGGTGVEDDGLTVGDSQIGADN